MKVIRPGCVGWAISCANRELLVEAVFHHPSSGLCYWGLYVDEQSAGSPVNVVLEVSQVSSIPGNSIMGLYNVETGLIES